MKKRKIKNSRAVVLFAAICLLFSAECARLAFLADGENSEMAASVTEKTVEFGTSRGYIYDKNLVPLVNSIKKNMSVIVSFPATVKLLEKAGHKSIGEAENGLLISLETEEKIAETDISTNLTLCERYSDRQLCSHIIGYINSDEKGVCGIEKSFDRVLSEAGGKISVSYKCDVFGRGMAGEKIKVNNDGYDNKSGIVLTVDSRIQEIAENALVNNGIEKGGCVILEVNTGKIIAIASVPSYDINNLQKSLNDENSPFLNRCLNAYPVGSVFKPFIAAAAIENGVAVNGDFECGGYILAGDHCFYCFNHNIHGKEKLNDAICNSCNCYFVDLGQKTGVNNVLDMCKNFGFGKAIKLTSDIVSVSGNLPDETELNSPAEFANLCFGQGKLLATPLQLAAAYSVFASGGIYYQPYITQYLLDENEKIYAYYEPENSYRVLDEGICDVISESLKLNMIFGTGTKGMPENTTAAGKTATAQTGKTAGDGTERLCTWFCGFFPCENPEYTVCVFNEDGKSASSDCAPVFKEIAEKVIGLGK